MENPFHIKSKIVLIPFPFDDLLSSKMRPALCLSNPIGPHQHIIVSFITSRIFGQSLPTDLVISDSDSFFPSTGLKVSSTIRLHRITTVSLSPVKREMGIAPESLMTLALKKARSLFE